MPITTTNNTESSLDSQLKNTQLLLNSQIEYYKTMSEHMLKLNNDNTKLNNIKAPEEIKEEFNNLKSKGKREIVEMFLDIYFSGSSAKRFQSFSTLYLRCFTSFVENLGVS